MSIWKNLVTLDTVLINMIDKKIEISKEKFIDKPNSNALKNKILFCHKCKIQILDKLVIKPSRKTRHYHESCWVSMFY